MPLYMIMSHNARQKRIEPSSFSTSTETSTEYTTEGCAIVCSHSCTEMYVMKFTRPTEANIEVMEFKGKTVRSFGGVDNPRASPQIHNWVRFRWHPTHHPPDAICTVAVTNPAMYAQKQSVSSTVRNVFSHELPNVLRAGVFKEQFWPVDHKPVGQ